MSRPLIFIDWDDTLFPTEWVEQSDINLSSPNETLINLFEDLDRLITQLVIDMVMLGDVLLVSNGSQGWLNKCMKILPNFSHIVNDDVISVTSARDLFKKHDKNSW